MLLSSGVDGGSLVFGSESESLLLSSGADGGSLVFGSVSESMLLSSGVAGGSSSHVSPTKFVLEQSHTGSSLVLTEQLPSFLQ